MILCDFPSRFPSVFLETERDCKCVVISKRCIEPFYSEVDLRNNSFPCVCERKKKRVSACQYFAPLPNSTVHFATF